MQLDELLQRYCLIRDLRESTEDYYRRMVSVYSQWAASHGVDEFTADHVSEMLRDKQMDGRSSHYRRSLRNALLPLLRLAGDSGTVRSVRWEPLPIPTWTAEEVARLVAAAPNVYWRTIIEAGWLSGLSKGDLLAIRREDVPESGEVHIRRSRTGKAVVVYIPPRLVDHVESGPVWEWHGHPDVFRQQFKRIVARAGVSPGPFKQLRRSAGSNVEAQCPGRGHLYLGNTRAVFEKHYMRDESAIPVRPVDLPNTPRLRVVG